MLLATVMRSRLLPLRRAVTAITTRKYAAKVHRCDAHMNELPIPCGPWDPHYKERQGFYTKILALGIIWWAFSLTMLLYTDSLYLNCRPPLVPAPPTEMIKVCEEEN